MAEALLVTQPSYRPTVISGGRRTNINESSLRAGYPWIAPHWRLLRVYDGTITWQHGQDSYRLLHNDCFLQPAHDAPSYWHASPGSRWGLVNFTPMAETAAANAAPDVLSAERIWGVGLPVVFRQNTVPGMTSMIDDMLDLWWRGPLQRAQADHRLAGLLLQCAEQQLHSEKGQNKDVWAGQMQLAADRATKNSPTDTATPDPFLPIDALLRHRPLADLDAMAQACGMSPRSLRRRFPQARGCSPAVYARRLAIDMARELLRQRYDMTVHDIARHLGYRHATTFIRQFKAQVGVSPGEWRQALRNPASSS